MLKDLEPKSHRVTDVKMLCFADSRLDGHNVAAIFGK